MFHLLAHLHSSFSLIRLQGNQVLEREMAKVVQKHTYFVLRNFSLFASRLPLPASRLTLHDSRLYSEALSTPKPWRRSIAKEYSEGV